MNQIHHHCHHESIAGAGLLFVCVPLHRSKIGARRQRHASPSHLAEAEADAEADAEAEAEAEADAEAEPQARIAHKNNDQPL